jgi:hypothetical protein
VLNVPLIRTAPTVLTGHCALRIFAVAAPIPTAQLPISICAIPKLIIVRSALKIVIAVMLIHPFVPAVYALAARKMQIAPAGQFVFTPNVRKLVQTRTPAQAPQFACRFQMSLLARR